jgi:DNA-binding MarR family transcriptional regulator
MDTEQRFAQAVVRFIRSFGLHRPHQTPCGIDAGVAEAHALSELACGPLRQADLVERLRLSKSTVSRLVDVMVERRRARRKPAPEDGRGVLLFLTADGLEVARRLEKARQQRLRAMLEAVPEDRRDDVIEVLMLMEEAARASDRTLAIMRG